MLLFSCFRGERNGFELRELGVLVGRMGPVPHQCWEWCVEVGVRGREGAAWSVWDCVGPGRVREQAGLRLSISDLQDFMVTAVSRRAAEASGRPGLVGGLRFYRVCPIGSGSTSVIP